MKLEPALLHFKFDNFASLPSQLNKYTILEETDSNGKKWQLCLFPGGVHTNNEPGLISVVLRNESEEDLDGRYILSVIDATGATVKKNEFEHIFGSGEGRRKFLLNEKFMKRFFVF